MKKRLFVDRSMCVGCRYCEGICYLFHNQANPRCTRIVVNQGPSNGTFIPVVCIQCSSPVCVEACQFDAMPIKPQLGIPTIDHQRCTGCKDCLEACPYGAIFFDREQGIAIMCDLCDGDPQCVKICRALHGVSYAAIAYITPEE